MGISIRPYRLGDRQSVRAIALATADRGRPGRWLFPHPEVTADLLTRYYTDFEPESSWVAEMDGRVVGYTAGSLHPGLHRRVMRRHVIPRAVLWSVLRGALWHRRTWQWAWATALTGLRYGRPPTIPADRYPAHMHVNVLPSARGRSVGNALARRFLTYATETGCPGVYAKVQGKNRRARYFFARLGFRPLLRYAWVFPESKTYRPGFTVVYVRRL